MRPVRVGRSERASRTACTAWQRVSRASRAAFPTRERHWLPDTLSRIRGSVWTPESRIPRSKRRYVSGEPAAPRARMRGFASVIAEIGRGVCEHEVFGASRTDVSENAIGAKPYRMGARITLAK